MNVRMIQLITAGLALLLMILCAGLTGSSAGTRVWGCDTPSTGCRWRRTGNYRFHVGRWNKHEAKSPDGVRYFIFVMEIILAILALLLLVWRLLKTAMERKRIVEIAIAAFAVVTCIVLFALEVWFACGKADSNYKAESWAAAAFFLLVGVMVWAADAYFSAVKRVDN